MGLRVPRDPRKTTGLIGRACKGRDVFSETVLTVDRLIIPTGSRFLWSVDHSAGPRGDVCLVSVHRLTMRYVLVEQKPHPIRACVARSVPPNREHQESTLTRSEANEPACRRQSSRGFVGDHRQGETPDPFPNSEVKLLPPMILLSGKVGYRRLLWPSSGDTGWGPFFLRSHGPSGPCSLSCSVREQ